MGPAWFWRYLIASKSNECLTTEFPWYYTTSAVPIMPPKPVEFLPRGHDTRCQRCKENAAVLMARKENFCKDCFIWFIRGKQRKQMLDERYKVKYGAVAERLGNQRVLLPLSFGPSSLVLFDMIASLLQEQILAHDGKQGFGLVVVHLAQGSDSKREVFSSISRKYKPLKIKYLEVDMDQYTLGSLSELAVDPDFRVTAKSLGDSSRTISQLLDGSSSRSSRADLTALLREQILLATAVHEECSTLLYGHSLTRLANEVISLIVSGRGSKVHSSVTDSKVHFGDRELDIIFPLREILLAEVEAVLQLSSNISEHAVYSQNSKPKLLKNMTVHDLTTQYFDGLDSTGYTSTASTVVKTAEKLGHPTGIVQATCSICRAEIHHDPSQWLKRITVNQAAALETSEERDYAEQWERSVSQVGTGEALDVCYGCTVTLAGAGETFAWPARASDQEILNEYILSSEDETEDMFTSPH